MTLSEELLWRGQIKDKTFSDNSWLDTPRTFYLGVDCSADSLTIGNLAVFLLARRLRKHGWKAVLLVGGATSLIGDPGGKTAERATVSRAAIEKNVAGVKAQVDRLFSGMDYTPVDNYDWFKDIGYLEFLRDVGKHYSMTDLLQRDYIQERIGEDGSGISYAEFSYSLIQGYDYWHLYKNFGVELQIGGSDQWGNMLSGVPLLRKKENAEVHALSMPLVINKSTGKKFGKSEEGAVWLDAQKTSPTQFYQFWLNVDDAGVLDYLKIYTELDKPAIDAIYDEHQKNPKDRYAQLRLAEEVTQVVHGADERDTAAAVTEYIAGRSDIADAQTHELDAMRQEISAITVQPSASVVDALCDAHLAQSKTEARRLLAGGSVYINGVGTTDETLQADNFRNGRLMLRKGKTLKNTALIELAS